MFKLDSNMLAKRLSNFTGYGNPNSEIWFIGIEEGCSSKFELKKSFFNEIESRINKINQEFYDIIDAHEQLKDVVKVSLQWFEGERPKLQKTWTALIKILFQAKGFSFNSKKELNNRIAQYQKEELGRIDGKLLLAEFLPLPVKSQKEKHWVYSDYADLEIFPFLRTRFDYILNIAPQRITRFRKLLEDNEPKVVIAYGKRLWNWIIQLDPNYPDIKLEHHDIFYSLGNIVLIQHPLYNYNDEQLRQIGNYVKSKLIE